MSVLKGEGKFSILYGSRRLPIGRNLPVYLSRPDAAGEHPTVLLAHGAAGINPHSKAVCRRLARYGFAVMCPDLYRGEEPGADLNFSSTRLRADLFDAYETAEMKGTEWADVRRIAVLGIDEGARPAVAAAPEIPELGGLAVVGRSAEALAEAGGPVAVQALVLVGGEDTPDDAVVAGRNRLPGSEWVLYRGRTSDFLDDGAAGYDLETADDAWQRLIAFLERATAG